MAAKAKGNPSAFATRRDDYFRNIYGVPKGPFDLNSQEFRFTALRRDFGNINIDRYVETVQWIDEGNEFSVNTIPVLRGTITLIKPSVGEAGRIRLHDGHVIKCDVKWHGKWSEVWRMRITKPQLSLDSGEWAFDLADDLVLATQSVGDFKFVAGKKRRKKGWRYDEIVHSIARRYRIPLGSIAKGKHRITNFNQTSISPLEAIRLATEEEVNHEFRNLIICWRYSKKHKRSGLNVVPLRRNSVLYQFKDLIRTADLSSISRAEKATALIVRGVQKHHGKRKKVRSRVVDRTAVKKYGYIEKNWRVPGTVGSVSALRKKAKVRIRRQLQVKPVVDNFTHPGIAFVRRGDAVRMTVPGEGFTGEQSILFVTSVTHDMSGGDYTMTLSLGLTDPVEKARIAREKAIRAAKRKKKGKHK